MRKSGTAYLIGGALLSALLAGCGLDTKFNEAINPPVQSTTPVAKIEPSATTVVRRASVTLKGNASSDPQGQNLTYAWNVAEQPTGSTAALSSSTDAVVSLVLDKGGFYTVSLQVTNTSKLTSNVAAVRLEAVGTGDNHPPVAVIASTAMSVTKGNLAILNGSGSYDVDGDSLTYKWSLLSAPSSSSVTSISSSTAANGYLTTDVAGEYVTRLVVSDGIDTDEGFVTVTAK